MAAMRSRLKQMPKVLMVAPKSIRRSVPLLTQSMRSISETFVLFMPPLTSHAATRAKSFVKREPGAAHGTAATCTPCSSQRTRGTRVPTRTRNGPSSMPRQNVSFPR